jgi:hypothetical protein
MRVRDTDADKGGLFAICGHGGDKSTGCRKIVKNTKNRKKMPKYLRMSKKNRKFAAIFRIKQINYYTQWKKAKNLWMQRWITTALFL